MSDEILHAACRKSPPREVSMSTAALQSVEVERTASLVERLEKRRRDRLGLRDRLQAREHVAREMRLPVGTLTGIARASVKKVAGCVRDRLAALLVAEIDGQIVRLQHERQMVLQGGFDPRGNDLAELEADLAALKALRAEPNGGAA